MKIQINRYDQGVNANPNLLQGQQIKVPEKSSDTYGFIADTLKEIKLDYDKAAINEEQANFQKESQNAMAQIQNELKGTNATPEALRDKYNKFIEEYKRNWSDPNSGRYLTSDQQKAMEDFMTKNSVAVNNSINYYSMSELQKAKQQAFMGNRSAIKEAIIAENQIDNINLLKDNLRKLDLEEYGNYSPEYAEQETLRNFSDALSLNISRDMYSNPNASINRFTKLEDGLTQQQKIVLQGKLLDSFIDVESQNRAEALYDERDYIPYINENFASRFDSGKIKGADIIRDKINKKSLELLPSVQKKRQDAQKTVESMFLTSFSNIVNSSKTQNEEDEELNKLVNSSDINRSYLDKITKIKYERDAEKVNRERGLTRAKQAERDIDSFNYSQEVKSAIQSGRIQSLDDLFGTFDWDRLNGLDKQNMLSELGSKITVDRILGENKGGIGNNIDLSIKNNSSIKNLQDVKHLPKYNQLRYMIANTARNMKGGLNENNIITAASQIKSIVGDEWFSLNPKSFQEAFKEAGPYLSYITTPGGEKLVSQTDTDLMSVLSNIDDSSETMPYDRIKELNGLSKEERLLWLYNYSQQKGKELRNKENLKEQLYNVHLLGLMEETNPDDNTMFWSLFK